MSHPERIEGGVARKDGTVTPFNAGDAVAATADTLALHGVKIPPTLRARLGKAAKTCLEDGFPPDQVVAAMVVAVQRGRVGLVEEILLDLQTAKAGQYHTYREYERVLRDVAESARGADSALDRYLSRRDSGRQSSV